MAAPQPTGGRPQLKPRPGQTHKLSLRAYSEPFGSDSLITQGKPRRRV